MPKFNKITARVGVAKNHRMLDVHQVNYLASLREQFKVITDNFQEIADHVGKVYAPKVLYDALVPTLRLAKKYTPKDTRALVRSGFLEIDYNSASPRVVIGFGRRGLPHYAITVHERVDLKHAEPTRSKFLLAALEEDSALIRRRIIKGFQEFSKTVR